MAKFVQSTPNRLAPYLLLLMHAPSKSKSYLATGAITQRKPDEDMLMRPCSPDLLLKNKQSKYSVKIYGYLGHSFKNKIFLCIFYMRQLYV